jgi:fructose-bisphosphate aldolase class I
MPLFQLCKGKDGLQLEAMGELYMKELAIAGAAALGKHAPEAGEGDHKGK